MLRKIIYALKSSTLLVLIGIILYAFGVQYSKYLLGTGLISLSIATCIYVLFLFKRYGDKTPIR